MPWISQTPRFRAALSASLCFLLLALSLAGCGGSADEPDWANIQRITGKVMMSNGTPLGQGKVVFTPQKEPNEPLSSWLDTDGVFTVMATKGPTFSHGAFSIHIEPLSFPMDAVKSAHTRAILEKLQKGGQQIPAKYQKPETSKLKVDIGPETKELPTIVLK